MRSILAALLLTLPALQIPVRASAADDDTAQVLANVPALAKLAAERDRAIEAQLRKVARIYVRAGYRLTGSAIRQSGDVVSLFAESENDLRTVRNALRKLDRALARERFYLVPGTVGDRLPNYRDLAIVFHENARAVLKNVSRGVPPTRKLTGRKGTLWLTRTVSETVEPRGSYGSSGSVSFWGSGTITVISSMIAVFPPDVELPPEGGHELVGTLGEPEMINGIAFPEGSLVVSFTTGFDLPDGAEIWTEHSGFLPWGSGGLALMSNGSFSRTPGTRWIAYPPGTTLPDNPLRTTLHLDVSYEANGVLLTPGSVVREKHESYAVPEGAIDLGGPNLELTRLGGAPAGALLTP